MLLQACKERRRQLKIGHLWMSLRMMLKHGPPACLIAGPDAELMMWIWQFGFLPGYVKPEYESDAPGLQHLFLVPPQGAYPGALDFTFLEASRNGYLFQPGVHQPVRAPPEGRRNTEPPVASVCLPRVLCGSHAGFSKNVAG
ncbi:unnamed protein product [Symbiodinium sp. CCMP2456]|nr:unnamed protein product [Symbiodinium sp. CCMP2456]